MAERARLPRRQRRRGGGAIARHRDAPRADAKRSRSRVDRQALPIDPGERCRPRSSAHGARHLARRIRRAPGAGAGDQHPAHGSRRGARMADAARLRSPSAPRRRDLPRGRGSSARRRRFSFAHRDDRQRGRSAPPAAASFARRSAGRARDAHRCSGAAGPRFAGRAQGHRCVAVCAATLGRRRTPARCLDRRRRSRTRDARAALRGSRPDGPGAFSRAPLRRRRPARRVRRRRRPVAPGGTGRRRPRGDGRRPSGGRKRRRRACRGRRSRMHRPARSAR
jgi:hypothetical protein